MTTMNVQVNKPYICTWPTGDRRLVTVTEVIPDQDRAIVRYFESGAGNAETGPFNYLSVPLDWLMPN